MSPKSVRPSQDGKMMAKATAVAIILCVVFMVIVFMMIAHLFLESEIDRDSECPC